MEDTYVPTAVGLDIFQGGFSLGVQRAGFDLLCNLEETTFGLATFRANFPNVPVHVGVENWPVADLAKRDVDLCYSNPPCVVFSAAALSRKDTWRNKAELSCTLLCFDTMERIRPAIAIWECVPRAWTMGRELVDAMTERWLKLGYSVTYLFNDSILFNTGQRRRRFMFVAHVVELFPELPPLPTVLTVQDALGGMEPNADTALPESLANTLRHSERTTGQRRDLREAWDELHTKGVDRGRPKMMDHRLDADRPCSTITGMVSQIHPFEERYLAPNEVARLCGYPDDYVWVAKNPTDFQQQCCKAVLPGAGEFAARTAMKGLEKGILTSNRVRIFDPRKYADWATRHVLDGDDSPPPAVPYADMQRPVPGLAKMPEAPVKGRPTDGAVIQIVAGQPTYVPAVAIRTIAGRKPRAQSAVATPPDYQPVGAGAARKTPADYPILSIGLDENGKRIRSRNPLFDADGRPVRRPVGRPVVE